MRLGDYEKRQKAKKLLSRYRHELLKKTNVVAVGTGYKKVKGKKTDVISIVCSVKKKIGLSLLNPKDIIPADIDRIPTDVIETGAILALREEDDNEEEKSFDRLKRWRPAPGGVSIGHEWITAGTLGCLVRKGDEILILSNNHVLADSNNAPLGSYILQPGKYDGGDLVDTMALLSGFVPIEFLGGDGCNIGNAVASVLNFLAKISGRKTRLKTYSLKQVENLVDAAVAKPLHESDVVNTILEVENPIEFIQKAHLELEIQKSGRTTGLTFGEVEQVDVTVQVQYGEGKIALFADQIMAGAMCAGGDSGSVVLNRQKPLGIVGLLFAGSDNSTVINPIQHVFDLLGVEILKNPKARVIDELEDTRDGSLEGVG